MKRISKSKNKGLLELPEEVVNRFGYTKKNPKAKYGAGKMLTQMKPGGDMSIPMQARVRAGREVPMTSAAYGKMEMAKYGKSKKLAKNKQGPVGDALRAALSTIPGMGMVSKAAENVYDSYGDALKRSFMSFKESAKDVYNDQMRDAMNILLKETTGTRGMNLFNEGLSKLDDATNFKKGGAKKARYGVSMQTPGKKKAGKKGKKTTTRRKKK